MGKPTGTATVVEDASAESPLRVAIAEDSGLLRAGIARLITDAGHRVVAEAGDGPGFLKVIGEQRPDVAVVDVRMPPGFKDEGLKAALRRGDGSPVSRCWCSRSTSRERYGRELLESGMEGTGYLLKDRVADVEEFVSAVETIGSGGTVLDPEVVGQLLARSGRNEGLASLTPREGEVLAPGGRGPHQQGHSAGAIHHRRSCGKAREEHLRQAGSRSRARPTTAAF